MMQKALKMADSLAYGHSYESIQRGLSNEYQHDRVKASPIARELARTCPAYFLGRQFPENLFGQANISMKNYQYLLFGVSNPIFY